MVGFAQKLHHLGGGRAFTDGTRKVVIPRNNPVNAITMAGIILDTGLSLDEFRKLL